jgi:heterodisulfide reductase subunit A-like polyferredoxin
MGQSVLTDEKGFELTTRIESDLRKYNNVTILTGAEVTDTKGSIGNFELKIRRRPQKEDDPMEIFELHVGSIVVATGYDHYLPKQGEYGFGTSEL